MNQRKTRSDCKLAKLSKELRNEIISRSEVCSLDDLLAWLANVHTFSVSKSSLSTWLAGERVARKLTRAVEITNQIAADVSAANAGKIDDAILAVLKEKSLNTLLRSDDPEEICDLLKVLQASQKHELDTRRVALAEKKAAAADAAKKIIGDKKLTAEQRQAELERILGVF